MIHFGYILKLGIWWGVFKSFTPATFIFQHKLHYQTNDCNPSSKVLYFKEGVHQGYVLFPGLFNFVTEYILRIAGLAERGIGIKNAGENINNLRDDDNMTLMAKSKKELNEILAKGGRIQCCSKTI